MELPCTSMACRIWKGTLAISVGDLAMLREDLVGRPCCRCGETGSRGGKRAEFGALLVRRGLMMS